MAVSTQTISGANDTLSKRRQINATTLLKRKQEVFALAPEIEELGYEISALGASFTMANLAKQPQKAAEYKQQMAQKQQQCADLLTQNGFSPDYLDPIYSCQKCKDKGFVEGKICSCLQQEIIRQRQKTLNKLSPAPQTTFEGFSLDYYAQTADSDGLNPRLQMQQILGYCQSFAQRFPENKKSILMCGTSGLGKTHLSCAIAKECMEKGFIVMYASSQSLFHQIEMSKSETQDILNDILNCDLFILDDLGTEYMTPYGLSVLYNMINTRMIKGNPCIFSTNLTSQKALNSKYGEKITSRLLGSCDTLYFIGNDIRLAQK